jgi:hypothetical protein
MRKLAILLIAWAAVVPFAQAQPNGVSIQLQLDQDTYLPDEDLQLKVHIVNRSGQPIVLGDDNEWITFEILGQHQSIVSKIGDLQVKGPFTLPSGEAVTKEFNPTPYFGFRQPGVYTIGATIRIPQWKQQVSCKPVTFTLAEGLTLANLGNLSFGVPPPPGATNATPEVRRYSLVRITLMDQMKLYFRLTDAGGRTLRVFPLARMVSFGSPEAQMDRFNNLHVLFQTGARTFDYSVIDPNGNLLARQFHEYTDSRPALHLAEDGSIFIAGGRRLLTVSDFPPPGSNTAKNP